MIITIVVEFQFRKELLNFLMESMQKNMGTNLGSNPMIGDAMVIGFNCNDNMHVTFIMKSLFGL